MAVHAGQRGDVAKLFHRRFLDRHAVHPRLDQCSTRSLVFDELVHVILQSVPALPARCIATSRFRATKKDPGGSHQGVWSNPTLRSTDGRLPWIGELLAQSIG